MTIPIAVPFQFATGTRMASKKAPNKGPEVALVINRELLKN
jgi:hypothetical protein